MRQTLALALVASLGLFACAGKATNEEAKSPVSDGSEWAGFTGDYSQSSGSRGLVKAPVVKKEAAPTVEKEEAAEAPAPKAEKAAKAAPKSEETEEIPAGFVAAKKPQSKGTVKGESVSSISEGALSTAAAGAMKAKVSSSGTMSGSRYEVVTVETKKATIKITRPASTPNPKGPTVTEPVNKLGDIGKTESAWYDADGDVIVVVSSKNKAAAAKILNSIVKK